MKYDSLSDIRLQPVNTNVNLCNWDDDGRVSDNHEYPSTLMRIND